MDVDKVFPLLFEATEGCEKLLSLDDSEIAKMIDESLVPDFPFSKEKKLDLNYRCIYLPKACLKSLNQLFEDFKVTDELVQLNLKYCLVSMINAKRLV